MVERIDEAEQRVAELEENVTEFKEVHDQSIQIQENLQEKLLDLETRSRRNNSRIFGSQLLILCSSLFSVLFFPSVILLVNKLSQAERTL